MSSVESAALLRAERGTVERVFYQGRPSWKLNHKFESWSDEEMTALGFDLEERFEHDPVTHARIQHTIEHPAPVELVKAALQAYSKRWAAQSHIDVDQRVALGVSIVGGEKLKTIADVTPKPVQVEHRGTPTEIEGIYNEVQPPDVAATSRLEQLELAANSSPVAPHDDPSNPITQDTRAREAARAASLAAGIKPPPVAPLPLPIEMRPDPDHDLPDDGSTPTKAAPPSMDAIAERIHSIKKKVRDNVPLAAIERQVAAALRRGDEKGARTLLGYRASGDNERLGRGDAPPGGAELTAGRTSGLQKMV